MRRVVATVAGLSWLAFFAAAMFTVMPLGAMGLMAIFDSSFTATARAEGAGFFALGLLAVAALFASLQRITRFSGRTVRAQD